MKPTCKNDKDNSDSQSWESRFNSFSKEINLIVLSTLIAIASVCFIEVIKMIILTLIPEEITAKNITLTSSSVTFVAFILLIFIAVFLVRRQITKIGEMYDINKYRFSGEFSGKNIPNKLKNVKLFYKNFKKICNGKFKPKITPLLTNTTPKEIKGLNEYQKENLLLEKISSLHILDIGLYEPIEECEIAKIRIEVTRLSNQVGFFCLCNCDKFGEQIKKELKEYFHKSSVLQSLDCNF